MKLPGVVWGGGVSREAFPDPKGDSPMHTPGHAACPKLHIRLYVLVHFFFILLLFLYSSPGTSKA